MNIQLAMDSEGRAYLNRLRNEAGNQENDNIQMHNLTELIQRTKKVSTAKEMDKADLTRKVLIYQNLK